MLVILQTIVENGWRQLRGIIRYPPLGPAQVIVWGTSAGERIKPQSSGIKSSFQLVLWVALLPLLIMGPDNLLAVGAQVGKQNLEFLFGGTFRPVTNIEFLPDLAPDGIRDTNCEFNHIGVVVYGGLDSLHASVLHPPPIPCNRYSWGQQQSNHIRLRTKGVQLLKAVRSGFPPFLEFGSGKLDLFRAESRIGFHLLDDFFGSFPIAAMLAVRLGQFQP